MKSLNTVVLSLAYTFLLLTTVSFSASACGKEKIEKNWGKWDIENVFSKKSDFALQHSGELGLDEQQVTKIKGLQSETEKNSIAHKAQIDSIEVDIKTILTQETLDLKKVNRLIDKKYNLKAAKSKACVSAYAAFKKTLSADQKNKLKELFMNAHHDADTKKLFCPLDKKDLPHDCPYSKAKDKDTQPQPLDKKE